MLCAKFDQNILNGFFLYHIHEDTWPLTLNIYKAQPLRMDNTCTAFNWNTLKSKISTVSCSQAYFDNCPLLPWPLTSHLLDQYG